MATVEERYVPSTSYRRILMIAPPVYDIRFPWGCWQHPITLLRLGAFLRKRQCDIHLIDCLANQEYRTRKRKAIWTDHEPTINYWRFGLSSTQLKKYLTDYYNEGGKPDIIYIEGATTFWWEGVLEVAALCRRHFPTTPLALCGTYPSLATSHAQVNCDVDHLILSLHSNLLTLPLEYNLYPSAPEFIYLTFGEGLRSAEEIATEVQTYASQKDRKQRVTRFAFLDHDGASCYSELFCAILERVAAIMVKPVPTLHILGTMDASFIISNPHIATLLVQTHTRYLTFADDRNVSLDLKLRKDWIATIGEAVRICYEAGMRFRDENLGAQICIGRPGEPIEEAAALLPMLAHKAGSLMVVPYQPDPNDNKLDLPLERQNGKLFPFARYNESTYRQYQDLLGLASVLNAKYRSQTFDFLGDSLVSRFTRASLVTGSWRPQPDKEQEHAVTKGYFNKEGKWVKSLPMKTSQ